MSRILGLSILLSICRVYIYVYMFGWLCRATCSFVSSSSMLGISYAVQNEKDLWNLHRVIGKVLVLDLLVVYKIPCSSCMWTRQDVIGVIPVYLVQRVCLWCTTAYLVQRVCLSQSSVSLHHCYCCLPSTTYQNCLYRGYLITELVSF